MTTALWLYEAYILNQTPGKGEEILRDFLAASERTRNMQMNIQAKIWLARHYLERNHDPTTAKPFVDEVLMASPEHAEAHRILRQINILLSGDLPPDIDPATVSLTVLITRIQQLFAQGEGPKAIEMVEQLYYRDETNLAMFELLANLYLQTRQVDKAKALIENLSERMPDDPKLQEQLDIQRQILEETDPEEQYRLAKQRADSRSPDNPVQQNLDKARLAAQLRKNEDCLAFLNLAEEASERPGATEMQRGNVISAQFDFAIAVSDFARAQAYADRAAALNLDRCNGIKFQAILYRAQNMLDESQAAMERVLELLPDDKAIRGALGELYLNRGRVEKAREHFRELAEADKTNFPGNYYMARLTEDDPAYWLQHFEYVRRCQLMRPDHPDVRHWVVNQIERAGKIDQAIEERERMAKQDPSDTRNLLALANLYKTNNRLTSATEMYTDLLARTVNPLPVADRYCRFLIETGQGSQVYQVMEGLIRENRIDKVAGFLTFGDLLTDISVEHARNAFQNAIDEAAKLNPDDSRPLLAMGRFLGRQGALAADPAVAMEFNKDAIGYYERWFALAPAGAGTEEEYRLLGLRIKVGQIDQTKARLEEILREDSGNMRAQFTLAELYRAQRDDAKALEMLDSAVALNATSTQPLMVRAAFYQELGDLPRAQADIERAKALDADNVIVAQSLAIVLMRQHKHNQAIGVLTEILTRDGTYAPAADLLLSAYVMQKDWGNVRVQLSRARTRAAAAGDKLRLIELYLLEAQMHRETGRVRPDSLLAMDNALALANDDVRVLARWLDAYINAGEHDRALRQVRERTGEAHRPLRLYEAAAMLGKGNVADANKLLTDMITNAKGELIVILDYIGKHYKNPADGLAAANQWVVLRDEAPTTMFLGDMCDRNRDIAGAEQAYAKALTQATTQVEKLHLHSRVAQMLYREYLVDRAQRKPYLTKVVDAWRSVLELDPNNFAAMNNLAYIFTDELDDPASALPHAVGAYNRDPQPDVIDTLGWTRARLAATVTDRDQRSRDLVAAAGILRQAYDLEAQLKIPHTVTICYHLAWTYEQLGDTDSAVMFYRYAEAALKDDDKDPLYAPVRDALRRVK
jgi:tetratricopeptide (TPR) repeat protein